MIIEQVEALKIWLTNKLSPICDAEPSALAKYVCALVKKDKPEQDLRDICVDQLDVFLQQNTKPFVDELFEVLKTKLYIPPASDVKPRPAVAPPIAIKADVKVAPLPPSKDKEEPPKRKFSEISSTTDDKENKDSHTGALTTSSLPASKDTAGDLRDSRDLHRENREPRATSRDGRDRERDREGSRDRRDSWRDDKNKDGIRDARDIIRERVDRFDPRADTREVREPRDRDHRDRDRDFRRRRTRSRSISPRRREYDDRRRRFDERPRYSPERRWGRRRTWSRSPRRIRSPVDRGVRALRSRSPKLRSRSPRDIRYRPPYRSRTRSRSRPRSWSRPTSPGRLRTRSPSNARQPDSRGSTPLQDNDYISSSTNDLPAVTSTVGFRIEERADNRLPANLEVPPPAFVQSGRPRCQNFEEKGFCMLGDVCPYDHGSDPVVVEDVGIPNVLPASNPPGTFIPPDLRLPPPGHMTMRLNLQRPPPQHVEPYLPEAPRLQGPPRQPFMRGPPDLRQPPPGMILNRPPHPDQFYPPRREVIMNRPPSHLEDGAGDILGSDKEPSRIVIPAKRPYSVLENDNINIGPPASRITYLNQNHAMYGVPPPQQQIQPQPQNQNAPPIRRGFDYNRLGRGGNRGQGLRQPFKTGNLTLEVRKIPPELNNIAKLNEHFGKFGNLTNIQVKYQNDPGAALISFSNNGEATAAYRSPEPVFNNRFIKLFWHNPEKHVDMDGETESPVVTMKDDGREVQSQGQVTGGRVGDGIDHPSLVLPVRSAIPPAHKLQLDNTKPKPATANATLEVSSNEQADTSIVYTSSIGNLKKTVFNPGATVPAPAGAVKAKAAAPFVSPTAVKTADYVSRMEAIKRMEEDKKLATIKQAELELKRQELLAKQIEQQKFLLETLEKKKSVISKEEKASLLKALRTISDAIDKVKYSTGAKKPASSFQAPTPAQFKYVSSQEQPAAAPPAPLTYGRGRGWAGGRGGWVPRGRGRNMMPVIGRTHLDNRPKTVEVKGFDLSELDEIRAHFQRFGEIEKEEILEEVPSAFFTFALRPSAEMAVSQGLKFKKKPLIVRWNQITPKISRAESTQSSEMDDDLSVTLGSLDEDVLLDISGEEKSEAMESNQLSSEVQNDQDMSGGISTSGQQEMEEDSRMFVDSTKEEAEEPKPSERKPIIYERSLSEDLLAGTEQHFKASYTDEEDDEDHITVTLSNTASSTPTIYTSGGASYGAALDMDVGVGVDDGEDLSNTLDYNEEGSWD